METESVSSSITPIATSAADLSTNQRRSVSKRRPFKRMIYGFAFSTDDLEAWGGSSLAIQMMRRSCWTILVDRWDLCSVVVTACGDGPPSTLLPTTRALAVTSRIGASPSRTISPLTPPRFLLEILSTGWRRIYTSRKNLNGIGFTAIER